MIWMVKTENITQRGLDLHLDLINPKAVQIIHHTDIYGIPHKHR